MLRWLWLSGLLIVLDQASKQIAENLLILHQPVSVMPFVNFTLMHNAGAAFSFLADAGGWQRWFFTVLSIGISVVLVIWIGRLKRGENLQALSLALILSGAMGNLIDRVVYGYVIDFIDVYYQAWHWPAFNVADSAITGGATLLVVASLFGTPKTASKPLTRR